MINPDRIGYACINMTLRDQNPSVFTSRTMRRKTFDEKGLPYASELALQNCKDLLTIVKWNEDNNIRFFRMSSEIFPWASEYQIHNLPDYVEIARTLSEVGTFAKENGHRLTFHPGPFNKLASDKPGVVANTVTDLSIHGIVMDMIGLPRTRWAKINIHVGATYGDKESTLKKFCDNLALLPESVRTRLTVENDDKASLYSTKELYEGVFARTGVPIVFDYHHHKFCTGNQTEADALALAVSTWGDVTPVVHYSESAALEEGNSKIRPQKHSKYIKEQINHHGQNIHVMVESKAKELAVLEYRKLFSFAMPPQKMKTRLFKESDESGGRKK